MACPNCTTIVTVMPLKPLHDAGRLRRVVATSYQAVSGAGVNGVEELREQTLAWARGEAITPRYFPHQIAFNVIPAHRQVRRRRLHRRGDEAGQRGRARSSRLPDLLVSPTTVRVPVFTAHSVAVNAETEVKIGPERAREVFARLPRAHSSGTSRPRTATRCRSSWRARTTATWAASARTSRCPNGLNFWVVGDQLRKGAALNGVQIAELLIR